MADDALQDLLRELDQDPATQQEQQLQARLRERAALYAQAAGSLDPITEEESVHVLIFTLGTERYAVNVRHVVLVKDQVHPTRVPGVPDFFRGVMNLRGQIITVLDLRRYFDLPLDDLDTADEVVVVEVDAFRMGLLCDHIEDVTRIAHRDLSAVDFRYARGVTADRIVLLDLPTLLDNERLIVSRK